MNAPVYQPYAIDGMRILPVHGIKDDGACTCGKASCASPGKHPVFANWTKAATSNVDALADMFRSAPVLANYGWALGPQDNGDSVCCIDVDDFARFAELVAKAGELPPTRASDTGRGKQLFFVLAKGQDPKRIKAGKPIDGKPGVDLKFTGGMVVIPPSKHHSGRHYAWANDLPFAELPESWYQLIASPLRLLPKPHTVERVSASSKYVERAIEGAARDIAATPDGARNTTAFTKLTYAIKLANGAGLSSSQFDGMFLSAMAACGLDRNNEHETVLRNAKKTAGADCVYPPDRPSWVANVEPEPAAGAGANWTDSVKLDKHNRPEKTVSNLVLFLEHAPSMRGKLRWNLMAKRIEAGAMPWSRGSRHDWDDVDEIELQVYAREQWAADWSKETVAAAVLAVANRHEFHPVREYLDGLTWDGTHRLASWLSTYASSADSELHRAYARKTLIALVARAYRPGAKVDTMLILEGDGGAQKSQLVEALCPVADGFASINLDVGLIDKSNRVQDAISRIWIGEVAEVDRWFSSPQSCSLAKSFLTTNSDHFRRNYATHTKHEPRQCAFIGSTNQYHYLRDETGNRRFWPVRVGRCYPDRLITDRDQLWAEAVAAYRAGESWWLTGELEAAAIDSQDERFEADVWEKRIAELVASTAPGGAKGWSTSAILAAVGLELAKVGLPEQRRVGAVMRRLGYENRRASHSDRGRVWIPPRPTTIPLGAHYENTPKTS